MDVADLVLKGERLRRPDNCPDELYDLMLKCWKRNPEDRPTFREVLDELLVFTKTIKSENAVIIPIDRTQEPSISEMSKGIAQSLYEEKDPSKKKTITRNHYEEKDPSSKEHTLAKSRSGEKDPSTKERTKAKKTRSGEKDPSNEERSMVQSPSEESSYERTMASVLDE
jgi:hypothetical protein